MKRGTFCSKLVALHFPPTSTPVKWWVLSHWSFLFLQKLYLWNSVWRSSSLCRTETWLGIFWQSVVFRVQFGDSGQISLRLIVIPVRKKFSWKNKAQRKSLLNETFLYWFGFGFCIGWIYDQAHHIKLAWTVILKNTPNISLSLRLAQLMFSVPVHLCMLYLVMIGRLWLKIRLVFGLRTRRYSNVQFGFWNQFVHLLTSPDVRRSDKISSCPFIGLNLSLFLSASM